MDSAEFQSHDDACRNKKWFLWLTGFMAIYGCLQFLGSHSDKSMLENSVGALSRKLDERTTAVAETHNMLPPIALITTGGCSGSSATYRTLKKILEEHGYPILHDEKELLTPKKNAFYKKSSKFLKKKLHRHASKGKVLVEAMGHYLTKAQKDQSSLLFTTQGINKEAYKVVDSLHAKTAFQFRGNLMSQALCTIRDCFPGGKAVGYSVFAENGTRTGDLCFQRRAVGVETRVHISDVPAFKKMVNTWKEESLSKATEIRNKIYPSIPASYESLFAFEYTDDEAAFHDSLEEWRKVLLNIIKVDDEILEGTLRRMQNTRPPPTPVSELIHNWEDVEKALGPDWETSWTVDWKDSTGVDERQ